MACVALDVAEENHDSEPDCQLLYLGVLFFVGVLTEQETCSHAAHDE